MPSEFKNDGTALSETDLYLRIADELKILRDLFRGMAQLRKDERWQHCAHVIEKIEGTVKTLYTKRSGIFLGRH